LDPPPPSETIEDSGIIEETEETTFDLTGSGSIQGRICDTAGGNYVVDALVSIDYDLNDDGEIEGTVEATTDVDGRFFLGEVPLGEHIIYVTKGSFSTTIPVVLNTTETLKLAEDECLDPNSVNIAVVTGQYDHIEVILGDLALNYDAYDGVGNDYMTLLSDPDKMAEYDIIFFNCGMSSSWTTQYEVVGTNIEEYVADGGSVYASDWAYYIFEAAFPDAVDFYGDDTQAGDSYVGISGYLSANVINSTFQDRLGSEVAQLYYDLEIWAVPETADAEVSVLLSGDAPILDEWKMDTIMGSPLAVRVDHEAGVAIYTTFHNVSQITVDMQALLEGIVFSL